MPFWGDSGADMNAVRSRPLLERRCVGKLVQLNQHVSHIEILTKGPATGGLVRAIGAYDIRARAWHPRRLVDLTCCHQITARIRYSARRSAIHGRFPSS